MKTWSGCRVSVLDASGAVVASADDAEVSLDDAGELLVSFFDDDGPLVFHGCADPAGEFDLWCRGRPRRATLCFRADHSRLEGGWRERDATGTWRIELR